MIPSVRLLALTTLIALSIWLGYLLGKDPAPTVPEVAPVAAIEPATAPAVVASSDERDDPQERFNRLLLKIEQLSEETDDRIINSQSAAILAELGRELNGPDAERFAAGISYYNQIIPYDGTALLLEAAWLRSQENWQDAMVALLAAGEFPESNEQLAQIRDEQTGLLETIVAQYSALEDWPGLIDYLNNLLIQDPINDRIRLQLAYAQANSGDNDAAADTLAITGYEGVSRLEIDSLRESLSQTNDVPIRFRDEGGALIARAMLNASPIELLVDTGATKTALAIATLRNLGAHPLNESTQVMTAAGRITAQLYRVPELIIEDQRFINRTVLALENPPARWHGLLGMDLLRDMNVDLSSQLAEEP